MRKNKIACLFSTTAITYEENRRTMYAAELDYFSFISVITLAAQSQGWVESPYCVKD